MADLDTIRLLSEQVADSERIAIAGLAEYLREAVRTMPEESLLCRGFYVASEKFERMAQSPGNEGPTAGLTLMSLERELRAIHPEEE